MVQGMKLRNFRRPPPIFGWADITLRIGPHSSLSYLEAYFEVFRPQWRHVAPIGVNRFNDKGTGLPKLKLLLTFDQNVEYKRPTGPYPLLDFYNICSDCAHCQDALAVKISLDLLKGLGSYRGYNFTGSGSPKF